MTKSFYPESKAVDSPARLELLSLIIQHCEGVSLSDVWNLTYWFDTYSEDKAKLQLHAVKSLPRSPYSASGNIPAIQKLANDTLQMFKEYKRKQADEMLAVLDSV